MSRRKHWVKLSEGQLSRLQSFADASAAVSYFTENNIECGEQLESLYDSAETLCEELVKQLGFSGVVTDATKNYAKEMKGSE